MAITGLGVINGQELTDIPMAFQPAQVNVTASLVKLASVNDI